MKKLFLITNLILYVACNNSSNNNLKQNKITASQSSKLKQYDRNIQTNNIAEILKVNDTAINKFLGTWCYKIRDSINFSISLMKRSDSIFCTYVNVLYGGKYLNAPDESNQWAFQVSINVFLDSLKWVVAENYYNSQKFEIKISSISKNILEWRIKATDHEDKFLLPDSLQLVKCRSIN